MAALQKGKQHKNGLQKLVAMTEQEFYARNTESQNDIKAKRIISHAEVKKMFLKSK
ncbi:MAG: hypothetical protein M3R17_14240 [Bacteroidota bacterium]|nr:hypothetical protein [Bacteroidota bacterium]